MDRKICNEIINTLEEMTQTIGCPIENINIQTRNRLFVVPKDKIWLMEKNIMFNISGELIAMPYSSIEYIST